MTTGAEPGPTQPQQSWVRQEAPSYPDGQCPPCRGGSKGQAGAAGLGVGPKLTDWELSLLLSRDLFLARRFFFLCSGRDSRIISSSSKVGSQCRRPFCGGRC